MGEAKRRREAGHIPGHNEQRTGDSPVRRFWWLYILILVVPAVALWLVTPARGHSFYPWECCSSQDCWPAGTDADAREPDPRPVPGGYVTADGVFIAQSQARPSPDGRFHICRHGGRAVGGVISPHGRPVCLWAPVPGS